MLCPVNRRISNIRESYIYKRKRKNLNWEMLLRKRLLEGTAAIAKLFLLINWHYSPAFSNGCKKYGTVAAASTISHHEPSAKSFRLEKALIVTKLSRYEYEESRNRELSTQQLEEKLRNRGTDFDGMIYHHNIHKKFEMRVIKSFQDVGCDVKVINRYVSSNWIALLFSSQHLWFLLCFSINNVDFDNR